MYRRFVRGIWIHNCGIGDSLLVLTAIRVDTLWEEGLSAFQAIRRFTINTPQTQANTYEVAAIISGGDMTGLYLSGVFLFRLYLHSYSLT